MIFLKTKPISKTPPPVKPESNKYSRNHVNTRAPLVALYNIEGTVVVARIYKGARCVEMI